MGHGFRQFGEDEVGKRNGLKTPNSPVVGSKPPVVGSMFLFLFLAFVFVKMPYSLRQFSLCEYEFILLKFNSNSASELQRKPRNM